MALPSSHSRKRQTRLNLTPLPSSSPAASPYHQQIRERAAAVSYDGSPSPAKRRKIQDAPGLRSDVRTSSQDKAHDILTPGPSLNAAAASQQSQGMIPLGDDNRDPIRPSQGSSKKGRRSRQKRLEFSASASSTAVAIPGANRTTPRQKAAFFGSQKTSKRANPRDDTVSDDEDLIIVSSGRNTRGKNERERTDSAKAATPEKVADHFVRFEEQDMDSGDSQDLPTTPALMKRKRKVKTSGQDVSSPLDVKSDSDSDDVKSSRSRRPKAAPIAITISDDNDSADDVVPSSEEEPVKKRRRDTTRGEQQELEDDLLDLQSSGSEEVAPPSRESRRVKGNVRKTAQQEALDRLKRIRAGNQPIEIIDGSQDDTGNDDEEDEEAYIAPRSSRMDMFTKDEEDDNFIADDGEDTLGAPEDGSPAEGLPMPIQFSRYTSMKAKELFKFAVEWMVQKKINPAFQHDDEIYDLAFKKLDDEIKGLAGSKFISAAWTPDFQFALRARPEIEYASIDRHAGDHWMRDKCDACNRTGHPATWQIQFVGKPYHRQTLEEVASVEDSDDSDSDVDEEEDKDTRDALGRVIVPESTTFYVGKFCMANAETAHSLEHWKIHLYQWVIEWLESTGYSSPENIVKRDKWSERKRRKHANKIVDEMEAQGKVKALYNDFKAEIDKARMSKQGRWDNDA